MAAFPLIVRLYFTFRNTQSWIWPIKRQNGTPDDFADDWQRIVWGWQPLLARGLHPVCSLFTAVKHFKAEHLIATALQSSASCRLALPSSSSRNSHRLRKNNSCRIHYDWFPSSSSYSYIILIILVIVITIVIVNILLLSHLLTLVGGEGQGFDRCSWKITIWTFIIIVIIIIVIIYRSSLSLSNVDVMKTL